MSVLILCFLSFMVGLIIGLIVMERIEEGDSFEPPYGNREDPPRFCNAPARRPRK